MRIAAEKHDKWEWSSSEIRRVGYPGSFVKKYVKEEETICIKSCWSKNMMETENWLFHDLRRIYREVQDWSSESKW